MTSSFCFSHILRYVSLWETSGGYKLWYLWPVSMVGGKELWAISRSQRVCLGLDIHLWRKSTDSGIFRLNCESICFTYPVVYKREAGTYLAKSYIPQHQGASWVWGQTLPWRRGSREGEGRRYQCTLTWQSCQSYLYAFTSSTCKMSSSQRMRFPLPKPGPFVELQELVGQKFRMALTLLFFQLWQIYYGRHCGEHL